MWNSIIATKLKVSFGSFSFSIGDPVFWIGILAIVLLFMKWWGIKRSLMFSVIIGVTFFLMQKTDAYVIETFGEEGSYYTLLVKPVFVFVIAFSFIYFAFIKKDT